MNNSVNTFYLRQVRGSYISNSLALILCIIIFLYWVPIYYLPVGLLSYVLIIGLSGLKISVHNNKLIIHKLFVDEIIIPFNSIESITRERRHFSMSLIAPARDVLVVAYTESSGYKSDFLDLYDEEIYNCIYDSFSTYKETKNL